MRRTLPAILAAAALAGCAAKPAEPPAPPPPVRAADGTYIGTSTRIRADARGCPSPGRVTLRILDGALSYRYGRQSIPAEVAADGTVTGALGDVTLAAKAVDDRIVGDVTSPACGYHFTTKKREPRVLSPDRP